MGFGSDAGFVIVQTAHWLKPKENVKAVNKVVKMNFILCKKDLDCFDEFLNKLLR